MTIYNAFIVVIKLISHVLALHEAPCVELARIQEKLNTGRE